MMGIKVFYTWSQSEKSVTDRDFGKEIIWDIPLLEGYDYEFVPNASNNPGSHHFFGINCPNLISRIENFGPEAILVFGWNFKSHLQVMRHFKGKIPIWFRGDSTLLDEVPGFKTKLRRLVLKSVYRYVDKALYVGEANKSYFLKHGLDLSQLIYVPHAIDNERFIGQDDQFDNKANLWRKSLGYGANDIVVLFVGKFEPKKQPDYLLQAVQMANKHREERIKLLFVGNGKLEKELKKMAGEDKHIQFLPFQNQSQMPIVYRLGHILCLPSKGPGDTWGLAVNEAMASGITVMASDKVGCVYDIIDHPTNGFIFAHNNPPELSTLLNKLDLKLLEDMGSLAQKKIQKWSFQKLVANIEKAVISE